MCTFDPRFERCLTHLFQVGVGQRARAWESLCRGVYTAFGNSLESGSLSPKDYVCLLHALRVLLKQVEWDKGHALAHLLGALGLDGANDVLPIYIGDDRCQIIATLQSSQVLPAGACSDVGCLSILLGAGTHDLHLPHMTYIGSLRVERCELIQ